MCCSFLSSFRQIVAEYDCANLLEYQLNSFSAIAIKQGTSLIVTFLVTDFFIPPNKTKFLSYQKQFRNKMVIALNLV